MTDSEAPRHEELSDCFESYRAAHREQSRLQSRLDIELNYPKLAALMRKYGAWDE